MSETLTRYNENQVCRRRLGGVKKRSSSGGEQAFSKELS